MILLTCQNIKKAFGANSVLEDASLIVQSGERIGLVGANGSGKTTLFNIILGLEEADGGRVTRAKGLRIGHLAQRNDLDTDKTVQQLMEEAFEPIFEMERGLRALEQAMSESDEASFPALASQYAHLTERFEEAGGYGWKSKLNSVLAGLKFSNEQREQPARTLSGGEKTRLSLAQLLVSDYDLLMLDEPTNHLDLDMLGWLEEYLRSFRGSVLVISHDRYFLDALVSGVCELVFGRVTQYVGNYTSFSEQRAEAHAQLLKHYTLQQREIERQEAIIARFRMYNTEKSIKLAESREKLLAKVERIDRPREEHAIRFRFRCKQGTGNDVLIAQDLRYEFGERVLFEAIDLHIRAGERVALIGPNGIGKSTLLKLIARRIPLQRGSLLHGSGVKIGYYDQQQTELTDRYTVIEEVRNAFPSMSDGQLRNVLASFLFLGDDVFQRIETLSGGERGRVALVKLMLRQDNFLLLDEPTNHLDMDSCDCLEQALEGFEGTMLVVSHDRYFINRFANRIWVLGEGGVTEYIGNYDAYIEKKRQLQLLSQTDQYVGESKTAIAKERRRDRETQARLRALREAAQSAEDAVIAMEEDIAKLEEQMADPANYADPETAQAMPMRHAQLKKELARLYADWEEAHSALEREENG